MIDPWTSQPIVIDIVNELFLLSTQLTEAGANDQESSRTKKLPKSQLPDLASALFRCLQERLKWLESPSAADQAGVERERSELQDRFRQLRPQVLETLRKLASFITQASS